MGVRCHTGVGVRQDDREAVQWFLRAAEQGHITAQATLGAHYGLGVEFPKIPPGMHALRVWRFCRMIKIPIAFRRGTATLPG
jgi:TPR repeat protein